MEGRAQQSFSRVACAPGSAAPRSDRRGSPDHASRPILQPCRRVPVSCLTSRDSIGTVRFQTRRGQRLDADSVRGLGDGRRCAMAYAEKRAVPRMELPERYPARVRGVREARLVDLSVQGARIEHHGLLPPGSLCRLELPSLGGALALAAEVVWSTVIGAERTAQGERHLLSRTGLKFAALTVEQRTVLAESLRAVMPGGIPSMESRERSA